MNGLQNVLSHNCRDLWSVTDVKRIRSRSPRDWSLGRMALLLQDAGSIVSLFLFGLVDTLTSNVHNSVSAFQYLLQTSSRLVIVIANRLGALSWIMWSRGLWIITRASAYNNAILKTLTVTLSLWYKKWDNVLNLLGFPRPLGRNLARSCACLWQGRYFMRMSLCLSGTRRAKLRQTWIQPQWAWWWLHMSIGAL